MCCKWTSNASLQCSSRASPTCDESPSNRLDTVSHMRHRQQWSHHWIRCLSLSISCSKVSRSCCSPTSSSICAFSCAISPSSCFVPSSLPCPDSVVVRARLRPSSKKQVCTLVSATTPNLRRHPLVNDADQQHWMVRSCRSDNEQGAYPA